MIQLQASNSDGTTTGDVTYSINNKPTAGPFVINRTTGVVTVSDETELNYEDNIRYRIVIVGNSGR